SRPEHPEPDGRRATPNVRNRSAGSGDSGSLPRSVARSDVAAAWRHARAPLRRGATVSESSAWDDLEQTSPAAVFVRGARVAVGSRVRLRPRPGGGVLDLALAGRLAVVESIDVTTDGEPHFVVIVDDDPGRDFGDRRYLGHRFYFRSEDVETSAESGEGAGNAAADSPPVRVLVAGIGNVFFGD